MTHDTRLMLGITLITVPTIIYGGLVLLYLVSSGAAGTRVPIELNPTQKALYRAGHAHAGVLVILSLILQICVDHASLGALDWLVRIFAPLSAILVSGGFFGLAHKPNFRYMIYTGAGMVALATVITGIGLLGR